MKLLRFGKDGGPESTVSGWFLIEIKRLFSIVLLRFENGSRDAYHSHAFDAASWVLWGWLNEYHLSPDDEGIGAITMHGPSLLPIITRRATFHKVVSDGRTWVLSFRGPWSKTWEEYLPSKKRFVKLSTGRVEVSPTSVLN